MARALAPRPWVPGPTEELVAEVGDQVVDLPATDALAEIEGLTRRNHEIHDAEAINLNPATNVMNPRAEALLSAHLGSRPSLGYPAAKYETGLEAIERIEIIAAELAAEVFGARYAEVRVGSGALANMYAFMATCRPGDTIIAPPAAIGGHVTHHVPGAAGWFGLNIVPAPVDPDQYTVDIDALRVLARGVEPRLITVGGSLNLHPHPISEVREIADEVGARVLFDAAHLCGVIAGKQWQQPLAEGAHLMTMSTYKSLGGPAGGLLVTDDAELAEQVEAIAHPGLTANFDAGKTAALAVTLLDWKAVGEAYARKMINNARSLAAELASRDVPVFETRHGHTDSHQFALVAERYGGGQRAARHLRTANLLACGIGLPGVPSVPDDLAGLRLGTPELTRLGMTERDMPALADLVTRGLGAEPAAMAAEVTEWRRQFGGVHFTADSAR